MSRNSVQQSFFYVWCLKEVNKVGSCLSLTKIFNLFFYLNHIKAEQAQTAV